MNKFNDLLQNIIDNPLQWQNYYKSTYQNEFNLSSDVYKTELTQFQKLMLFRCFQQTKLKFILQQFVGNVLHNDFAVSPIFDLASAFSDSQNGCKPLLFLLSNYDPIKTLRQFAETQLIDNNRLITLSLGQKQASLAMKSIETGIKSGDWVILQNCHLAGDWINVLERICDNFTQDTTHPDFRLWLTTLPTPTFPLSILQNCIKLVNEPPHEIHNTLLRTFTHQPAELENRLSDSKMPMQLKRLLYSISFFHALVKERCYFGAIGWNNPYDFNENDLHFTIDQIFMMLNVFDAPPFDALQTLMVDCNYGGHIADAFDEKCLKVLTKLFCSPAICERGKPENDILDVNALFPAEYTTVETILRHVNGLDDRMDAPVYGLHQNVNILREKYETNDLLKSILLTQVRSCSRNIDVL